jgi:transposase
VGAAVERGEHTRAEIARLFNVSRTFIKKMLRWQRAGQDLAPRQGGGPTLLLQAPELSLLCAEVGACPAATRAE